MPAICLLQLRFTEPNTLRFAVAANYFQNKINASSNFDWFHTIRLC